MKQNFFAVDMGATSGRTILGTFIEGGFNLEEINRFPNHLIEVGCHFYWDIYALYRHIICLLYTSHFDVGSVAAIDNILFGQQVGGRNNGCS